MEKTKVDGDAGREIVMNGLQEYMLEGNDKAKMITALNSFEVEAGSWPATPTDCFLFMLMIASPGPEFLPALAELLTETISTGFLSKENVLAGLTDEKGFAANIAALAEAKAMPNLPVAFGTLLAPLVKSGFLTQAEVDGGLDKCLAAFPEDRDALKAEIATRATA